MIRSIIALFLVIIQFTCVTVGQNSYFPGDRCTSQNISDSALLCLDCRTIINCGTGATTPCDLEVICDQDVSDGTCILLTNYALSEECMCDTTGCHQDPNNNFRYVNCEVEHQPAVVASSCTVDETTIETFNVNTCKCETLSGCPNCDLVASDNSGCPPSFIFCLEPENPTVLPCQWELGQCFDSSSCSCVGPTCPTCGKYSDPYSEDNNQFCICGDGIEATCGLTCEPGFQFYESTCDCSTEPPPTSTMDSTTTTEIISSKP